MRVKQSINAWIHHHRILLLLWLVISVTRFGFDIYLPSLATITHALQTDTVNTQLTISLYLLGVGLSQMFYGPLSEVYGRKKTLIAGLILFCIANLFCAFTQSILMLITARLIAGIGAGASPALKRAIAADNFSGEKLVDMWARLGTPIIVSLTFAPLLGAYILHLFGWRANFFIIALYSALVIGLLICYLPETHCSRESSLKLHHVIKHYRSIMTSRMFINNMLISMLAFSGLMVYFQLSPFLLIQTLKLTPVAYGWLTLLIVISYLIGGLCVRRLVYRMNSHRLLMIGISLLIASGVLMLLADMMHYVSILSIMLPSMIYVMGARIVIPTMASRCLTPFRHIAGYASAAMGGIQMGGSAIVSFIAAKCYGGTPLTLAIAFTLIGIVSMILLKIALSQRGSPSH